MKKPCSLILCIFFLLYTFPVPAKTLQEGIEGLDLLPLQYGANEIRAGDDSFLVIRGQLSNNASLDESYSVLVPKKEAMLWVQKDGQTSIRVHLHTYEDSLSNVRFLKSGDTLHLLYAQRPPEEGYAPSPVTFTLSALEYDVDFRTPYFQEKSSYTTEKPYCNVDWALHVELGLPLRDGHNEMPCIEN